MAIERVTGIYDRPLPQPDPLEPDEYLSDPVEEVEVIDESEFTSPEDEYVDAEGEGEYGQLPPEHEANLAEFIDDEKLTECADHLIHDYESDLDTRKDWVKTYIDGLEYLGISKEERTIPWDGVVEELAVAR